MHDAIVVINAGSSSIKFCIYAIDGSELNRICRGLVERINTQPRFIAKDDAGNVIAEDAWDRDPGLGGHRQAYARVESWLETHLQDMKLMAVGHRVVHGGAELRAPTLIDDGTLRKLESFIPLAPLHQPHNLAAIQAVAEMRPELPQVACFDTAFHRGHAKVAERFGLPDRLHESGICRFGFHGLSYEYIAQALARVAPDIAKGKVVVAHLGNGASMCAINGGRSVDSTLGFTALDGLPMGTRCGSLDPGVVIHLLRGGMSVDEVEHLLYRESGLLGISGISNDMRRLLASESPRAAEAIDYFVYRIVRELGALTAVLGGLDALVFTAGIGANSPPIRATVCEGAAWLGIRLDDRANEAGEPCISPPGTTPSVWALPTDEERMIAMHTHALISQDHGYH